MPPKKRKRPSGLTGIELAIALEALKNLATTARLELNAKAEREPELESDDDEDEQAEGTVLSQIEKLTAVLQARADSYSFSGMTGDLLDDLKVRYSGKLKLKDDAAGSAALSDTLGNNHLWSATNLLAHLHFLENLVPRCNVPATRQWINAFFYRVSTMIPNHLKMALSIEQVVPTVTVSDSSLDTVSGFIDYMVAVMDQAKLEPFLERPVLRPDDSVLFVSEAKDVTIDLPKHIPQAVAEMLGYARRARKTIMRGVVTDGREWLFLILTLRDDGTATFVRSDEVNISGGFTTRQPTKAGVSLISAILAHWIVHSHEPLDETTDYFES